MYVISHLNTKLWNIDTFNSFLVRGISAIRVQKFSESFLNKSKYVIWLKDREYIDGPLGLLEFPDYFGLSVLRLSCDIVYISSGLS